MSNQEHLKRLCRERHWPAAKCERVLRLNVNRQEGEILRGVAPRKGSIWRFLRDLTSKGEIIRRYGREAWESVPKDAIIKEGRRECVGRSTLVDLVHRFPRKIVFVPLKSPTEPLAYNMRQSEDITA